MIDCKSIWKPRPLINKNIHVLIYISEIQKPKLITHAAAYFDRILEKYYKHAIVLAGYIL